MTGPGTVWTRPMTKPVPLFTDSVVKVSSVLAGFTVDDQW